MAIVIGHNESHRLIIEPTSRMVDGLLIAEVGIYCGVWSGKFACEFRPGWQGEIVAQLKELHRDLNGRAKLDSALGTLHLKLTGSGAGLVMVEGVAKPGQYMGTRLIFALTLDQMELPGIIAQLLDAAAESSLN